jgi:hypothetical protein
VVRARFQVAGAPSLALPPLNSDERCQVWAWTAAGSPTDWPRRLSKLRQEAHDLVPLCWIGKRLKSMLLALFFCRENSELYSSSKTEPDQSA